MRKKLCIALIISILTGSSGIFAEPNSADKTVSEFEENVSMNKPSDETEVVEKLFDETESGSENQTVSSLEIDKNGYFIYDEDFSAGPLGGYGTIFDGTVEKPATSKKWNLNGNGDTVFYENPNGAAWKISTNPEYQAHQNAGIVGFYKENEKNAMTICSYGGYYKGLAVADLGNDIDIKKLASKDKQKFSFTLKDMGRVHAVALFVNDDEGSFILFGSSNGEDVTDFGHKVKYGVSESYSGAFVTFFKNGKPDAERLYFSRDDVPETNKMFASGQTVNWNVTIESGKLFWTAVNGGYKWEGSAPIDISDMENSKYIGGFYGIGDTDTSRLYNFKYEAGNYYTARIGEPKETIYSCVSEDSKKKNDETIGDYFELKEKSIIRRAKINRSNYFSDTKFYLSEGGEGNPGNWVWDEFDCADGWVNTVNDKEYRYYRIPKVKNAKFAKFYLLKNIENNPEISIEKQSYGNVYRYLDGIETPYSAETDDDTVVSVNNNGYSFDGIKDGAAKAVIKGETKDFVIKINVIGDYSKLISREDKNTEDFKNAEKNYLDRQNSILMILNDAIRAEDKERIKEFFASKSNENGVNGLDGISLKTFTVNDHGIYKLSVDDKFVDRILTYKNNFFRYETIEDISKVCELLKQEVYTGKLNNIDDKIEEVEETKERFVYDDEGRHVIENGSWKKETYTETVRKLTQKSKVVQDIIENNNDVLKLNIDNEYYLNYKDGTGEKLSGKIFLNYEDLNNEYNKALILSSFEKIYRAENMLAFLNYFANEIKYSGYDAGSNKITLLKTADGTQKNKFTQEIKKLVPQSVEDIKNFIDNYSVNNTQPPTPPTLSGGSSGGTFSRGGISVGVDTKNINNSGNAVEGTEVIFADVPIDFWGFEAIRYMHAISAVRGYADGMFKPDKNITRGEFIQMLMNVFKPDVEIPDDFKKIFKDVDDGAWYAESINKAGLYGIVTGDGGYAYPEKNITRQEMAAIIFRILEKQGKTIKTNKEISMFADAGEISPWAYSPVLKLQAAGVISGTGGKFMPFENATRAAAAQMLYKAVNSVEEVSQIEK